MTNSLPRRIARLPVILLALLGCALTGGCLPTKFVIDLAPGDGSLKPAVVMRDEGASDSGTRIAMIDVIGLISETPSSGIFSGASTGIDGLMTRLDEAARDPKVKAIILRVNSPGGTTAGSEVMYTEIRRFREQTGKPVVVSMGEVAASGGYYISLAADHIVAQPTTITASIGVIAQTFNFSKGMDRYGIQGRAVVSGPNKDMSNPFEPPVEEHYILMQGIVDEQYHAFRDLVAHRRPGAAANAAAFAELTDGRVVTGRDALRSGLVDSLGTVRDAFAQAKDLAGVTSAVLIKYHPESSTPPRSPYAAGAGAPTPENANPAISLGAGPIQVEARGIDVLGPGFYYLWIAPAHP